VIVGGGGVVGKFVPVDDGIGLAVIVDDDAALAAIVDDGRADTAVGGVFVNVPRVDGITNCVGVEGSDVVVDARVGRGGSSTKIGALQAMEVITNIDKGTKRIFLRLIM
jgi:hypothetical protein